MLPMGLGCRVRAVEALLDEKKKSELLVWLGEGCMAKARIGLPFASVDGFGIPSVYGASSALASNRVVEPTISGLDNVFLLDGPSCSLRSAPVDHVGLRCRLNIVSGVGSRVRA